MSALWKKFFNRETLLYVVFGVFTMLINWGLFALIELLGAMPALINNAICFVAATAFAFVTNKLYVFRSESWAWSVVRDESIKFTGSRLLTFGVEELGIGIAAHGFHLENALIYGRVPAMLLVKGALSLFVVLVNYFLSKFLIFSKNDQEKYK